MRIAVVGVGNVGLALARGWQRAGHDLVLGVRDRASESARAAAAALPGAELAAPAEAAGSADVVVLAVPFQAALDAAAALGDLGGRVLVDCTNPVGPGLVHGLASRRSGSEAVQEAAPSARVVKAFSIYGYEVLGDAAFPGAGPAVMMLAGDDAGAVATVSGLAADLGFEPLHVGGLEAALQLEHLTLLWVRMVRAHGHPPGLAWRRLARP